MNTLINEGIVELMACGPDFAYVLSDNNNFLPTEYKVLQNQNSSEFIKCMKTSYNGKIQIYYLLEGLTPLAEMVGSLSASGFLTITAELLNSIIAIKGNGFLSCRNIDISFNKIYVDPGTNKVKIVYLPIRNGFFDSDIQFENSLRTRLIKAIQSNPNLKTDKTDRLLEDLTDGTISLETLSKRMKSGNAASVVPSIEVKEHIMASELVVTADAPCLKISSTNATHPVQFTVREGEFVIGKKADVVDGVITFNGAISRRHCKISKTQNGFMITDLGSANGTFVNRNKLAPEVPCVLNNGDIVRLANSDFEITIE